MIDLARLIPNSAKERQNRPDLPWLSTLAPRRTRWPRRGSGGRWSVGPTRNPAATWPNLRNNVAKT
jgi:hypothetical protein